MPTSINPAGAITGLHQDATGDGVLLGFLRARDGTFTTFEAPGAGTVFPWGTSPYSINPAGAITGTYQDASNVYHGFLRTRDGTFATFDAPAAGTGYFQGTTPFSINPEGAITGYYTDSSNVFHGFLRIP
jgi:hypothetical protein